MHTIADTIKDGFPALNVLLAALFKNNSAWLNLQLEWIALPQGYVLVETGGTQEYAYFPTAGVISLLYVMENGRTLEIAASGREGMVGVALFMGGQSSFVRTVVSHAGQGYRIKAKAIQQEFARNGELQQVALRYAQTLLTQMAQSAVCNRSHTLGQQLCRWLLVSLDRAPLKPIHMTHEAIASMLGVRRVGVTEAARFLQAAGAISYSRGLITILDRGVLEDQVCECYAAVIKEYDRLFPGSKPMRPASV